MLIGAHAILYSKNTEADRAFLQKVLALPYVDVGEGWLIFSLPPAEIAVHPADSPHQELYLMCANVSAFVEAMTFFFKQKTAYEIIAGDWSSDVCSSDLLRAG